jgi:hypothetical protein
MFAIELRRKSAHSIEFGSGYVRPSTRAKGRDLRTEGGNLQREVDAFHRRRIGERYQEAVARRARAAGARRATASARELTQAPRVRISLAEIKGNRRRAALRYRVVVNDDDGLGLCRPHHYAASRTLLSSNRAQ